MRSKYENSRRPDQTNTNDAQSIFTDLVVDAEEPSPTDDNYDYDDAENSPVVRPRQQAESDPDFITRLCDHKLLSRERELELTLAAHAGDRSARNMLIQCNLRLVVSIAKKFVRSQSALTLQDLIQEGSLGLMVGLDKFDPSRGYRLSTYVTWWIRQSIQRAIQDKADLVRIPVHVQDAKHKIVKSTRQLCDSLGRMPTLQEIEQHSNMPAGRVATSLKAKVPIISLDFQSNPESDTTLQDIVSDTTEFNLPESRADQGLMQRDVGQLLAFLKPHERRVVELRYGFDGGQCYSLDDTGRQLGVSRERARQLEISAMRKLRERAQRTALRTYVS